MTVFLHTEKVFYHESYKTIPFIVVSGPSAGGKSVLAKKIVELVSNTVLLIKQTSRLPRENEVDGLDYYFLNDLYFKNCISDKNTVVIVNRYDNYYALSVDEVNRSITNCNIPVFILDPDAAVLFKSVYPESIIVFVAPSSQEIVVDRINSRGGAVEEKNERIALIEEEFRLRRRFDIDYDNGEVDRLVVSLKDELVKRSRYDTK